MRDVDLAYLAGVVDADGYVTATKTVRSGRLYVAARLGITGSRTEPHDLARELFGGGISVHVPDTGRPHYQWALEGSHAIEPITALLPYLRIKSAQAHLVLALQEHVQEVAMARVALGETHPWMPAGYDPTSSMLAAVDEIRALHARTQAHLRKAG